VDYEVHVDNILFLSADKQAVQQAIDEMTNMARDLKITFSEIPEAPSTSVIFLGIEFDLTNKTCALTQKTLTKFEVHRRFLMDVATATRWNIIPLSIFGGEIPFLKILSTAATYSRIMFKSNHFKSGSMSDRYNIMQLLRAVCRTAMNRKATFECHRGSLNNVLKWINEIPRASKVANFSTIDLVVTTDACVDGGGYIILYPNGEEKKMAFPWREKGSPEKMGCLEMRSITIAIRNLCIANVDTSKNVKVITDSSICIGAISKGYSPSCAVNEEVKVLFEICRQRNVIIVELQYIKSEENPADSLSRKFSQFVTPWVWEQKEMVWGRKEAGRELQIILRGSVRYSPSQDVMPCADLAISHTNSGTPLRDA